MLEVTSPNPDPSPAAKDGRGQIQKQKPGYYYPGFCLFPTLVSLVNPHRYSDRIFANPKFIFEVDIF